MHAIRDLTRFSLLCWGVLACDTTESGGPITGRGDASAGPADSGGSDDLRPVVDDAGAPIDGSSSSNATYYPLKVGNWWKYRVTSPFEAPWEKVVTADRMEPVGGAGPNATRPAIRLLTLKGTNDMTINWQGPVMEANGLTWVRYRETAYAVGTMTVNVEDWWDPPRLRVDERLAHTTKGTSYQETYFEYKSNRGGAAVMSSVTTSWLVDEVDQTVVVQPPNSPTRTYTGCIQVSHSLATPGARKTFWFCRGIGKVKETGGQTEELIDHKVEWP